MAHRPETHRSGCPCCSPYVWGAYRPRPQGLSRRGFFGAGAALTAAGLAVLVGNRAGAEGLGASALAFAAPALMAGETRRSRAAAAAETTVYRGGTIRTMNAAMPLADAVAVSGGRILAAGSEADVAARAGRDAKIVDLSGEVEPSPMEASGYVPPEEWTKAVDTMRRHQRICWARICQREMRKHEQRLEEDKEYGKRPKERREATPEQGDRSPKGKDDASEDATQEGKKKRPRTRTATRSATPTSRRKKQKGAPQKSGKKTRSPSRQKERNTGGKEQ